MNKVLTQNIKQLSQCYRNKTLNPIEVIDRCTEVATKHKDLNYFITFCPERAARQAEESSQRWTENRSLGSLDGIPIAIKDNFCVKGMPTTCASKMLESFVPAYDATPCARLEDSGSIILGKTNMDEFGMGSGAIDSIFGPTQNIWRESTDNANRWHIAGGSSGGSAVAVATGTCYAALGSDTGGSVRNPASYCGLIGLKPTYGLVSRNGLIPLVHSMDVPGILARTTDDCAEILNAIAGPDELDSTCVRRPFNRIELNEADQITVENIKIGIPKEYHCNGLSANVLQTWTKIADILEDAGAKVKNISMPNTAYSIFVYTILNQCEVSSNMSRYDGIEYGYRTKEWTSTEQFFATNRQIGFNDVVKNRILTGNYFLLERNYNKYFEKALRVRRLITDDFNNVFNCDENDAQKVDVILTPTTLTDAPIYQDFVQSTNRDQCAVQDFCTQPANMAGIPAIAVPIRLSENGLPLSLQLMGAKFSEETLLTVAKWIESQVNFPHFQHTQTQPIRERESRN